MPAPITITVAWALSEHPTSALATARNVRREKRTQDARLSMRAEQG